MTESSKVLILLDADVVIHLFKADRTSLLNELYESYLCCRAIEDYLKNHFNIEKLLY